MNCTSISNQYYINNCVNYNVPSFEGRFNRDNIIRKFNLNPIRHFKNFSIEEYSNLSEKEILKLRKKYNKIKQKNVDFYDALEQVHDTLSDTIKNDFDDTYGEKNYTVIVIGRSLSSVGKVLGYKIGEDRVKNIPMSCMQKYTNVFRIHNENKIGKFNKLKEFLHNNGLSKNTVDNSGKKHVLIDYCISGDSLKGAYELLNSKYIYNNSPNLVTGEVRQPYDKETLKIVKRLFYNAVFKELSFVDKCVDFKKIQDSVINPQKAGKKVKLIWFKLLDNVMSKKST